jgi:prepilin-type N-terminal cleavage/methylation domain-containing protein
MKKIDIQSGHTLTEMLVVIAIMALLATLGMPAVRALLSSFEFDSGTRGMLSAALTNARSIAAKEQRYAGVRFQQDSAGNQYMIFIVHDPEQTGLSSGFRAAKGYQPVKLPKNTFVADLVVRANHGTNSADAEDSSETLLKAIYLDDTNPQNIGPDLRNKYVTDILSFSIIFSPAGKLVLHNVRVRNRDGVYQPDNTIPAKTSRDDVFNSPQNITNYGMGMFIQDDYAAFGLGAEASRNRIITYDGSQLDKLNAQERFNYLSSLEPLYINPYTGTIINK